MPDEGARHVTLIGESALHGNLGQAASDSDQAASTFGPDLPLPFEWRHSIGPFESPQELVPAHADAGRQLRQRWCAEEIIRQSFADLCNVATGVHN